MAWHRASFFPVLVFNKVLRRAEPGSMALVPQNNVALPAVLTASLNRLTIEKAHSGETLDMVVRDAMSGFVFFKIEGNLHYDASTQLLGIQGGRLLISEALANNLGRAREAGTQAGTISIDTAMVPIATSTVVNGKVESSTLPPGNALVPGGGHVPVPGPDIIVGDLSAMVEATPTPNPATLKWASALARLRATTAISQCTFSPYQTPIIRLSAKTSIG